MATPATKSVPDLLWADVPRESVEEWLASADEDKLQEYVVGWD
jgi:hypothetical protein